jgi:hypothetical protein
MQSRHKLLKAACVWKSVALAKYEPTHVPVRLVGSRRASSPTGSNVHRSIGSHLRSTLQHPEIPKAPQAEPSGIKMKLKPRAALVDS